MKVTTEYKEGVLTLSINDEVVRTLSPTFNQTYKFKYNNEEFHFIVEKKFNRTKLWLYPMADFNPNVIEL